MYACLGGLASAWRAEYGHCKMGVWLFWASAHRNNAWAYGRALPRKTLTAHWQAGGAPCQGRTGPGSRWARSRSRLSRCARPRRRRRRPGAGSPRCPLRAVTGPGQRRVSWGCSLARGAQEPAQRPPTALFLVCCLKHDLLNVAEECSITKLAQALQLCCSMACLSKQGMAAMSHSHGITHWYSILPSCTCAGSGRLPPTTTHRHACMAHAQSCSPSDRH